MTDSVEQLSLICNVNVGVSIRTDEEGFWGPITCQQLHRSWIKPEPEPHSQYQQARQLKKWFSHHSY